MTHCCLVNLIDVTLTCEDTNSKLFDVATVADVVDEDRVGNSLLQILKLNFCSDFLHKVWLKLRQDLRLTSFFSADLL